MSYTPSISTEQWSRVIWAITKSEGLTIQPADAI